MPITKEFQTIQDRIDILETRKLKFKNKKRAEQILKKYNYFDIINGFESILLKQTTPKKEYENIIFEDFFDLYKLDMCLKKHSFFMILDIESRIQTSISYHFTAQYCNSVATTLKYLDSTNYQRPSASNKHLTNVFNKFDLFRQTSYYNNGAVKRKSYIDELKSDTDYVGQYANPPFWVTIKAIPFGTLYYTYLFLDSKTQDLILKDFNFDLTDNLAYQQAIFVLKELRNQCAHLELITRFRLKRTSSLNYFNDITKLGNLSKLDLNYMDSLKILKLFGSIKSVKWAILSFYIKMTLKGRNKVAKKILGKMGRKNITAWLSL